MNNPVKNWRNTKKLHNIIGKTGKLLVWTKVSTAPTGFEYQAPYYTGIIELENQTKMPIQIIDCEESELKTNMKIKLVTRRLKKPGPGDVIDYGIKAAPILK